MCEGERERRETLLSLSFTVTAAVWFVGTQFGVMTLRDCSRIYPRPAFFFSLILMFS